MYKGKTIISDLEKEIERLDVEYDKSENNPGRQAIIQAKLARAHRRLGLWTALWATVEDDTF